MSLLKRLPIAIALVVLPAAAHAQDAWKSDRPQLRADSLELARKYAGWMVAQQADSIWAHTDSTSRARLQSAAALQVQMTGFAARAGAEVKPVGERWIVLRGRTQYLYESQFANAPEPLVFRIELNPDGTIGGSGLRLRSASPAGDPKPAP